MTGIFVVVVVLADQGWPRREEEEHSPPTKVARIRILASTPYVVLVFSLALGGFSPDTPVFLCPIKPTLLNSGLLKTS